MIQLQPQPSFSEQWIRGDDDAHIATRVTCSNRCRSCTSGDITCCPCIITLEVSDQGKAFFRDDSREQKHYKTLKWVVWSLILGQGSKQETLNQIKTWTGQRQVWAVSQVHLHRPCSASNQQSRLLMTGCCCQRTADIYTHTHTEGHVVITQRHACTHTVN